jgi:hypothetical protein
MEQLKHLMEVDLINMVSWIHIRERHMPVVILMPSIFLELKFLFLELLDFNSPF